MTVGIDFKGMTSSAVARPPLSGREGGTFSGILEVASSIVVPISVSTVEMVDWEVTKFSWPKHPSKISSKMRCWYQQGLSLLFLGPCTSTWQLYLPNVQLALIRSDPRNKQKTHCLNESGYRMDENPHKGRRSSLSCSYLHQKLLHNILWKDT